MALQSNPSLPLDAMNEDTLLLEGQKKKDAIETAKAEEMELRQIYCKARFPKADEGTNKKDLGQGYQLKAVVNILYLASNDTVEATLEKLTAMGAAGSAIADSL